MYFVPKQEPKTREQQQKTEEKKEITYKKEVPPSKKDIPAKKIEKAEIKLQKDIIVETPLLKVTFTDLGGGISSVKLKRYKELVKESKPKEIIEDIKPYIYLPKLFKVVDGEIIDDRTYFKPNKTNITIQDKPETLVFTGNLTNGKQVKKIYTFYPDNYIIDMKIEIEASDKEKALMDFAVINGKNPSSYTFKGPFVFNGKKFEPIEKIEKNIEIEKTYKYAGLDEGFFAFIWISDEDSKFPLTILKTESNTPVLRSTLDKGTLSGKLYFGPKNQIY
jgi:YidC/Oxa1 family membrane protein insertase